jgi:hypothetical protein
MKHKVLSVRQPYASLLVNGIKDVENRGKRTNYRGTLLIHASVKMHDIVPYLRKLMYKYALTYVQSKIVTEATLAELNDSFGVIIGSVDIVDCVENHPSEWAEQGQWHWICANARKLKHPIPAKGMLGLWEYEGEIKEEDYE